MNVFLCISVFNFLHKCFIALVHGSFTSLDKFIPKYFILLDGQGCKPDSAAAAGRMGPEASPPDRMVPQKRPCDDGGREWSDTVTRGRMAKIANSYQKPERVKKGYFPTAFRRSVCLWHPLDFRLLTPTTMQEYTSISLSHQACGILVWLPQEINTICSESFLL